MTWGVEGAISMPRIILIALDSVGIDPLGHGRPESVYAGSRFLFPYDGKGDLLALTDSQVPGALVETQVIGDNPSGAIECAITYTSIFSGQSAANRHGLMQGLGLKDAGVLKQPNAFPNRAVRNGHRIQ